MSGWLTPVWLVLCALLVTAGGAKLRRPQPPVVEPPAWLSGAWSPLVGAGEVIIGVAAALVGGPVSATLVVVVYTAFTIVVTRKLRGARPHACGCFGAASTVPTSRLHLVLNGFCTAAALACVVSPPHPAASLARGPLTVSGAVLVGVAAATAGLVAAHTLLLAVWQAPEVDGEPSW